MREKQVFAHRARIYKNGKKTTHKTHMKMYTEDFYIQTIDFLGIH